ncbi:hypothetical protein CMQ_6307 [Grosmannia clavigera kw1407]|uniref:Prolyl 4-hydroxylase alpha subunit Fe(2+) 2OG dioxygenase domain-containing protein n=1 Tax=Grosmannia clavigera (strain kw1407 / UAMH 11150) TaxID=655863 RepID=F0XLB9_GROCL|nr:uncharacterized protein CMQ_6307 [Grosmannia clavigera kw1407]EFX01365.1 hypothetical protein CMQ_6307 [Grosmannia clavigera kw1407]
MPLQEPQARQIIEKARQAPYGKGEETVVDTSVRSTWELDAGQFELQGPAWERLLETVLASVKKSLGVVSPIRAELYKMLLYEKGAMFKAHTDSPKIPGMFGTLVIVLPSIHQGGEVVLRHRGEKKVFASSHVAQGFMGWYSDVQHEVLPVTMGYRWALTYNMTLVDPAADPPFASRLGHEQQSHLFSAVEQWIEGGSGSPVYTLDHNYTEARISLQALKGRDMAVVQALRDISSKLPVDIFLAILEKQDTGSCDGGDYYGHYSKLVRNRCNEDDEDDETDGGGGDLHGLIDIISTTHSFKKLVDLNGTHLAEGFVLYEKDLLVRGAFANGRVKEIDFTEGFSGNELCNRAWQPPVTVSRYRKDVDGPAATLLLQAAVQMRDWVFFDKAVQNTKNGFTDTFYEWITGELANGLPFADVKEPVVPLLAKRTTHVPVFLEILSKIAEESRRESDEKKLWLDMYELLVTSLITSLDILSLNAEAGAVSSRPAKSPTPKVKAPAIGSKWLAELYKDLLSLLPISDLAMRLAQRISRAAEQIRPEEFVSLWIPFLQQLVPVLEKSSVPLSTPQYQEVFVALLDAYLKYHVCKEVTDEGRTLQRPTVPCQCGDCARLNAFLGNSELCVGRFAIGKRRRQHLHNVLDGARIDCQHVTERLGNPQTLVVRKTSTKHEAARKDWLARKTEAEKLLHSFPNEKLRTLLGAEYLRIFHMEDILWSEWKVSPQAVVVPGPPVLRPSVPARGLKRKAETDIEVVDLTGLD